MDKNYYDVLGVGKNATSDEIKKAFRELSKKYHPDRNGGDDTKFKEINEAYSVIGNDEKRREYDGRMSGGHNPFASRFRQMPSDVQVTFTISLEEAYEGCTKTVNILGKTLAVDIPKGTFNGKMMKIEGMGQNGYNSYGNLVSGDLIVKTIVKNTEKMWLDDNGLLEVMCGVEWIDAILGSTIDIDVFGRNVKVKVPKFTQNGGWTIVSGSGFRKFKSDELGNLKVNFIIRMPKTLTDNQMKLLSEIKESL